MFRFLKAPCVAFSLCAAGVATAQDSPAAQASFLDLKGQPIGTAKLDSTQGGVLIALEVTGLPASSWVAFHIHESGTCDPAAHYETAGGHFNPSGTEHGFRSATGPHAGDMPNIWVDAEGRAKAELFNPFVVLTEGETLIRGRALMIHAGADDHVTQPSGGAGDRLACAVIE